MTEELSGPIGSLSADASSPEPEVRWRTAALLSELPGEESETLLLGLLKDADYRVRERTVAALAGRFGDRAEAACLVALEDDDNAGHRAAALSLLVRVGRREARFLVDQLRHASPDVRLSAAQSLPVEGSSRGAVAPLEEALLGEQDTNVRAALLLALGRTGRREAVATLLSALESEELWGKVHALQALGEIGDPDTSASLVSAAGEPSLRRAALRALARLATSRPAEELASMAARDGADPDLLHALRTALEAGSEETAELVRQAWPGAFEALRERLLADEPPSGSREDATHLLVLLDLKGGPFEILRAGLAPHGAEAFQRLSRERLQEALHAVLQVEDPEPALVLIERAVALSRTQLLPPLLVHPAPSVRAAALLAIPAGSASLSDLIDILAEEDSETALPAALALAASAPGMATQRADAQKAALLDRVSGPDGVGRIAALLGLAQVEGADVDTAIEGAFSARDPDVRVAALQAASERPWFPESPVRDRLEDVDPAVRAAALRTFARWSEDGRSPLALGWKDCLVFLADEPPAAAAAGAAIIALAGEERPRLAEELLAQEERIRIAALEEIPRTGDPEAAASVALAVTHEEMETARAALLALSKAPPGPAEPAAAIALADVRAEVRRAAAELVERRGPPPSFDGPLSPALAKALMAERVPGVVEALLRAVAAAGGKECLDPLTERLAEERPFAAALAAAMALAARHELEARRCWQTAPARAERRWAQALSALAASRSGGGAA